MIDAKQTGSTTPSDQPFLRLRIAALDKQLQRFHELNERLRDFNDRMLGPTPSQVEPGAEGAGVGIGGEISARINTLDGMLDQLSDSITRVDSIG